MAYCPCTKIHPPGFMMGAKKEGREEERQEGRKKGDDKLDQRGLPLELPDETASGRCMLFDIERLAGCHPLCMLRSGPFHVLHCSNRVGQLQLLFCTH